MRQVVIKISSFLGTRNDKPMYTPGLVYISCSKNAPGRTREAFDVTALVGRIIIPSLKTQANGMIFINGYKFRQFEKFLGKSTNENE
jgi:hypothetical protein